MSVKWQKVKLGEICSSVSDGDHLAPPKTDVGIPFVTISDIKDNRFDLSHTRFVSEEYYQRIDEKRKVHRGDVLYSVVGSYGIPVFADTDLKIAFQRHIAILRPSERLCPKFLYYSLKNPKFYKSADGAAVGSAQKTISLSSLRRLEIDVPSLPVQKKIASILSAYDDLIENNRRRIAILEEMARKVYRRRFGGKKANGTIAELASANDECYKAGNLPSEINYVDIASVSTGRIDGKTRLSASEAPGRARRIARNGDVIWSNVRPNLKAYALVLSPDADDVFSTGFTVLRARNNWYSYLYMAVTQDKFVSYLEGCVSGATYPAVRPDDFLRAEVYVPSEDEGVSFQQQTETIYNQMQTLVDANRKLAAARDTLLPKLMSGKLEALCNGWFGSESWGR